MFLRDPFDLDDDLDATEKVFWNKFLTGGFDDNETENEGEDD